MDGTPTTNYVKFYSELRDDAPVMNTPFFPVKTAYRLKTIDVVATVAHNYSRVRSYKLEYDVDQNSEGAQYSNSTGRSVLTSVQQFGKDVELDANNTVIGGSSLPAIKLNTSPDVNGFIETPYSTASNWGPAYLTWTGDFDGDGKTDIATATQGGTVWVKRYQNGSFVDESWGTFPYCTAPYCYSWVGDFNGDGKSDIARVFAYGTIVLLRSTGHSFVNENWANLDDPRNWSESGYAWVGDFDGNGKTDIATASAGTIWVKHSTGLKFDEEVWTTTATNWGPTNLTWIGDFDGDGKSDIATAAIYNGSVWVKRSTGTAFVEETWLSTGGAQWFAYRSWVGDVNGDGKDDVVLFDGIEGSGFIPSATFIRVWRSTGSSFIQEDWWSLMGVNEGSDYLWFGDFNGDGKPDIAKASGESIVVWRSAGSSFVKETWTMSAPSWGDVSFIRSGDFNGDGKADIATSSGGTIWVKESKAFPVDLVTSISNGLGGTTSIEYAPSTIYNNTLLPFPIQTVRSIKTDHGLGIVSTTEYEYSNGYYHIGERDFRGFNHVKIKSPAGTNGIRSITETWYQQGGDILPDINNPADSNGFMKGKPYRTKISDEQDKVYSVSVIQYSQNLLDEIHSFNPPQQVDSYSCEGSISLEACIADANSKHIQSVFTYNNYGNIIREDQLGDKADSNDDRTVVKSFTSNRDTWILGLPDSESIYKGIVNTGSPVSATSFYYDEAADCSFSSSAPAVNPPIRGNLTRIVRTLDTGTSPEVRMAYDSYGNLKCTKYANGNISTLTYDGLNTFPIESTTPRVGTNPNGYKTRTRYYGVDDALNDKGLYGQVKSVTDPNGSMATTEYDAFGRIVKIIKPYDDSTTYSSASYFYENFGIPGIQNVRTYSDAKFSENCPAGYFFNSSTDICEAVPNCSQGTYDPNSDQCILTTSYQASPNVKLYYTDVPGNYYETQMNFRTNDTSLPYWEPGSCSSNYMCLMGSCGWITLCRAKLAGYFSIVQGQKPLYYLLDTYGTAILGYSETQTTRSQANPALPFWEPGSCILFQLGSWRSYQCKTKQIGYLTSAEYRCSNGGVLNGASCSLTTTTESTCPSGSTFNSVADACQIAVESVTRDFTWSETYFDGFGRTIKTRRLGPDSKEIVSETRYDSRGFVEQKSLPYFEGIETPRWIKFTYDSMGRILTIKNPDDTQVSTCYDKNVIVLIDANNQRKRETENAQGKLVKVEEFEGKSPSCTDLDAPYAITTYEYDVLGNLIKVTDAVGNETIIGYDSLGRKRSMHDPDMGNWTYEYDPNGNLTKQTDANGQIIKYSYDELNRIKMKDYPSGTDITYFYDELTSTNPIGRLTTMIDASGATKYFYDQRGRTTKITKIIDGTTHTTESSYDLLDRLQSIKYPSADAEIVSYIYDGSNNLLRVTNGTTNYVTYSDYNALSQPGKVTYGNNVTTNYNYYESNNRLKDIVTIGPASNNLLRLSYAYYNNGNVMGIADNIDPAKNQSFVYDELNRIVRAESSIYGSLQYVYNQIGNFLGKEGINYYYQGTGPHAVTSTSDQKTYTYDLNGNMLNDSQRTVVYNYDNMPISVTSAAGSATFVYDGTGARVKKETPNGITTYIGKLYECNAGSCSKYIFAGGARIALKTSTETIYYHKDHLGSSSIVTDAAGNKVEEIHYLPFGASQSDQGAVSVNHKYTSQEFDSETGLYYYNARYYNPTLGRFITADAVVPDFSNPQAFNRYSYVINNPLLYIDPSGQIFGIDDILIGAAIGAIIGGTVAEIQGGHFWKGALPGAISGAAFGGAGGIIESANSAAATAFTSLEQAGIHMAAGGISGGINSAITHSNIGLGIVTGGLSGGIAKYAGAFLPDNYAAQFFGRSVIGGFTGGISAEIYGGTFGQGFTNGATTAGIAFLANDLLHKGFMKALAKMQNKSVMKSIKSFEKNIAEHEAALKDPSQVLDIQKHEHELRVFREQLGLAQREAAQRGLLGIGAAGAPRFAEDIRHDPGAAAQRTESFFDWIDPFWTSDAY